MEAEARRGHAREIFQAGLEAVHPGAAVLRKVALDGDLFRAGDRTYPLDSVSGIRVVGFGKASAVMAQPIQEILGERITHGVVVVPYRHTLHLPGIRVLEAGHPVPDEAGVQGAREVRRVVEGAGPDELVLCLISGGGSSLLPAPVQGVTLPQKQEVTQFLLSSGATIHQINTVRKHLSQLKGGQLARLAHPATMVSLILSDVVGDDLHTIASGPTTPDPSTFRDALEVLREKNIADRVPPPVVEHLKRGERGEAPDTPKPGEGEVERVDNVIVGSNRVALAAAQREAEELGYFTSLPVGFEEGEAREVGRAHVERARQVVSGQIPLPLPACILTGGEPTVTLRGDGLGGRNQELALAAALEMEGMEDVTLLSGGTDGTDGPTDAAGAVADVSSVARGRAAGMEASEYLARNDSYHFFQPLGDLVLTGPSLTNVMDLRIMLVG